jgi:hypothetical protein
VQGKYLRGMLGVDRVKPGYTVREECKKNRLKVKAGKTAANFEQNGGKGRVQVIGEREREREKYYQRNAYVSEEVERLRATGR